MAGGRIIRANGRVGISQAGRTAVRAAGNCNCCGALDSCTRCTGTSPTTITAVFSGIQYRASVCCDPDRYIIPADINGAWTLNLVGQCSWSGVRVGGFRRQRFGGANCSLPLIQTFTSDIVVSLATSSGGGGLNLTLSMLIADVANPADGILFDRVSLELTCIRDRPLGNQDFGYQTACDLGGGGGTATLSW